MRNKEYGSGKWGNTPLRSRKWVFFFFTLLISAGISAQKDSTRWVREFEKTNRVTIYAGSFDRSIQLQSQKKEESRKAVRYAPNSFGFVGLNVQYKKLFLYLETAIPNTHKVSANETDVKGYALFFGHFKKAWGFTAFAGYNSGLLMGVEGTEPYVDRNDIRRYTAGFHYYKIFRPERFSYISPNSGGNQQIRSAGSPMLLITPAYNLLRTNGSLIPRDLISYHFTGSEKPIRSLEWISLQVKPGYIYNFIWGNGRYFFSPSAYAGLGTDYHILNQRDNQSKGLNLNMGYRFKMIAGINNDDFYITAEWLKDVSRSFLYRSQLTNVYREYSLNLGIRF